MSGVDEEESKGTTPSPGCGTPQSWSLESKETPFLRLLYLCSGKVYLSSIAPSNKE